MRRRLLFSAMLVPLFVLGPGPLVAQDGGPPPHVRIAVDALVRMAESRGQITAQRFAAERLTDEYRAALEAEGHLADHISTIRRALMGHTGDLGADVEADGSLRLVFGGPGGPAVMVTIDEEGRFGRLELAGAPAEQGPPGRGVAIDRHTAALERLPEMSVSDGATLIAESHLSDAYGSSLGEGAVRRLVEEIREAVAMASAVMMDEGPEGILLDLRRMGGGARITFRIEDASPFAITRLEVDPIEEAEVEPLAWDGMESLLEELASDGFSGAVLVRRGGEVTFRQAYGMADRAAGRASTVETAYGIGSTPIDFTITLALLSAQRGTLDLDASIAEYLPNVPADKRALTPRMILDGRSGLPDFFDIGEDWDADLAWIDRDAALRRLMNQELLFAPGTREAHSHGAYVLLAALLEEMSGTPYRTLVYRDILDPLGMTRTGFYGESRGLGVEDFATGYGSSSIGVPNIPPNWGPTSWLIMGSGGMFSTLADMDRFYNAMKDGEILEGEWRARYQGRKGGVGGSDRGFFFIRATNGEGDQFTLMSNTDGLVREDSLVPRVIGMVWGPGERSDPG